LTKILLAWRNDAPEQVPQGVQAILLCEEGHEGTIDRSRGS
jgi:hypothetical protein